MVITDDFVEVWVSVSLADCVAEAAPSDMDSEGLIVSESVVELVSRGLTESVLETVFDVDALAEMETECEEDAVNSEEELYESESDVSFDGVALGVSDTESVPMPADNVGVQLIDHESVP